ncbi:DUF4878 domain-containing protein [Lujinxingia sediminis]|uniref:DUF4878 domain-containing protein n=1 Tax=Lujinxingia sediminis TaxID=2480984 RepID=A0ABY0CPV5_9DELT|nr:DUF4878 domain-containing protein [Lujinxingia sediminis]RVU42503.1 DUF4878 domain-containing protein [Lujinxingia sediminis]
MNESGGWMRVFFNVGVMFVVVVVAAGCQSGEPRDVAVSYLEAMRDGEMREAWERVRAEDQAAMPLAVLKAQGEQAESQVEAMSGRVGFEVLGEEAISEEEVVVRVDVVMDGASSGQVEEVRLWKEAQGWRVDTDWSERQAGVLDRPEEDVKEP